MLQKYFTGFYNVFIGPFLGEWQEFQKPTGSEPERGWPWQETDGPLIPTVPNKFLIDPDLSYTFLKKKLRVDNWKKQKCQDLNQQCSGSAHGTKQKIYQQLVGGPIQRVCLYLWESTLAVVSLKKNPKGYPDFPVDPHSVEAVSSNSSACTS